jgi:hypothetical protein
MVQEDWVIKELEKAGILRVGKSYEALGKELSSLIAEVALTEKFIAALAWNLTKYCTVQKSIDNFKDIVTETVRTMLSKEGDISKHVALVFTVLEASNIKKAKLEKKLMEAGYLAAK